MVKFFGSIGFGETVETSPGVWEDVITEREFYGDVLRNSRGLEENDKVNFDLSVGNSLSIVADAYAQNHFFAMRYVMWAGAAWVISDVTSEPPRLVLRLGGVYNGPRPESP